VPAKRAGGDRLFKTIWVHVFEEDTDAGAVYRPEDGAIPLSRRPRERIELDPDGTARFFLPGPDDRFVEQPAAWKDEAGALVIRARKGGAELRITDRSPDRLVVQMRRAGPPR
jgi:hypothetical protein